MLVGLHDGEDGLAAGVAGDDDAVPELAVRGVARADLEASVAGGSPVPHRLHAPDGRRLVVRVSREGAASALVLVEAALVQRSVERQLALLVSLIFVLRPGVVDPDGNIVSVVTSDERVLEHCTDGQRAFLYQVMAGDSRVGRAFGSSLSFTSTPSRLAMA